MSGRLIILPHKKWHVWNRDNRERVARDEREAADMEQVIKRKQIEVDMERRVQELKNHKR